MNSMRLSAYSTMMGQTIVAAVTSESKRFFLGTDSAPHERQRKECSCGCAGIYNAPVTLSLYAMVCEELQHISVLNFSRPSSNHGKMTSLLRSSLQLQTLGV